MFPFINPAPIVLTIATLCGVMVHDMHIDKATALAASIPALAASADMVDKYLNGSYHTHVERASFPRSYVTFRSTLPQAQPGRDNDRRHYVQNKKTNLGFGSDHGYMWPST